MPLRLTISGPRGLARKVWPPSLAPQGLARKFGPQGLAPKALVYYFLYTVSCA
jgi:hypothetical protein